MATTASSRRRARLGRCAVLVVVILVCPTHAESLLGTTSRHKIGACLTFRWFAQTDKCRLLSRFDRRVGRVVVLNNPPATLCFASARPAGPSMRRPNVYTRVCYARTPRPTPVFCFPGISQILFPRPATPKPQVALNVLKMMVSAPQLISDQPPLSFTRAVSHLTRCTLGVASNTLYSHRCI